MSTPTEAVELRSVEKFPLIFHPNGLAQTGHTGPADPLDGVHSMVQGRGAQPHNSIGVRDSRIESGPIRNVLYAFQLGGPINSEEKKPFVP